MQLVDTTYALLESLNAQTHNGLEFRDVMAGFVVVGDEACLQASPTGTVRVFGDATKKKHEIIAGDPRCSITIVRTAATGGSTGPTQFLCKGAKVRAHYTSDWLIRNGAAAGSGIYMTPSAFMTKKAWEDMATDRAKGIRAMPVIRDHPDWWALDILDGDQAPKEGDLRDRISILRHHAQGSRRQAQPRDRAPGPRRRAAGGPRRRH